MFLRILVVIAAAYAALVGALAIAMRQPPDSFGAFMAKLPPVAFMVLPFEPLWMGARAGKLQVGEPAPGFSLKTVDGGSEVRLDSFRGKRPVVLIFGSYTWPPFRREVPALNNLYDQYKDRAEFLVVYIREAHPSNAWQMAINVREQVIFADPRTFEERIAIAENCVRKLGIRIPALVDDVGDGVEAAYTGWPDRLYVIDGRGKIAFKSAPGPYGFVPSQMEAALRKVLPQ